MNERGLATRTLRRRLIYLLVSSTLAMWLAAVFASATLASSGQPFATQPHDLAVTASPTASLAGWMPGDTAVVQTIDLRATGAMHYQMKVTCSGSQELAQVLVVTITDQSGRVLYQGPLSGATVGGSGGPSEQDPALADGETAAISITATLPLGASGELAGAGLQFTTVVSSYEDAD
jgi:hypothetical protein